MSSAEQEKREPNPSMFPVDISIAAPILEAWLERLRAGDHEQLKEAHDRMHLENPFLLDWIHQEHEDLPGFGIQTTNELAKLTFLTNLTLHEVLAKMGDRSGRKVPKVESEDLHKAITLVIGSSNGQTPKILPSDEGLLHNASLEWEKIMKEDDFMRFFSMRMNSTLPHHTAPKPTDVKKISDRKKLSLVTMYRGLQYASQPAPNKK